MPKNIVIIAGPTASGKTEISIKLAKKLNGEIISADSMQIYRGMDIGTAKIKESEMQGVPHHLINIVDPDYDFSVAEYQMRAKESIDDVLKNNRLPIIVGGTGLYIHSLINDIDFTKTKKDVCFRNEMDNIPISELYLELLKKDPDSAARISKNDKKRIIRRLEIINDPVNALNYDFRKKSNEYNFINLFISWDRKALYDRINRRVDIMFNNGLISEVRELYDKYGSNHTSMQAIGYKEIIELINSEDTDTKSAIDKVKLNTRHYAKRQITWFRRYDDFEWFEVKDDSITELLINDILNYIKKRLDA